MKTIIKIVVAIMALTACFNVSRVLLNNYQFEDAVHNGLLFDPRATDAEIVELVGKVANEYSVPMDPQNVKIHQTGPDIHVSMSYVQNIVLIPGVLARDWTFTPTTSTRMLVGNRRQP